MSLGRALLTARDEAPRIAVISLAKRQVELAEQCGWSQLHFRSEPGCCRPLRHGNSIKSGDRRVGAPNGSPGSPIGPSG